jgi:hypothetical protein
MPRTQALISTSARAVNAAMTAITRGRSRRRRRSVTGVRRHTYECATDAGIAASRDINDDRRRTRDAQEETMTEQTVVQAEQPTEAQKTAATAPAPEEKIRLRAYELYLERNCAPGHADEDWFAAESEIVGGTITQAKE